MPVNLKRYREKIARRSAAENEEELKEVREGRDYLESLLLNAGEIPAECPEFIEYCEVVKMLEHQLGLEGAAIGRDS